MGTGGVEGAQSLEVLGLKKSGSMAPMPKLTKHFP